MSTAFDEGTLREFVDVGVEELSAAAARIAELQQDPQGVIGQLFRCFHSLKGTAAMLGFEPISRFAHRVENALDKLRKGDVGPTPERVGLLVSAVDLLTETLCALNPATGEATLSPAHDALLNELEEAFARPDSGEGGSLAEQIGTWFARTCADDVLCGHPLLAELQKILASHRVSASRTGGAATHREGADAERTRSAAAEAASTGPSTASGRVAGTSLRVEVAKFDRVVELAGELFHIDQRLKHVVAAMEDGHGVQATVRETRDISRQFEATLDRLYERLMDIQKLPFAHLTQALERIVRQLSREQEKEIEMVVHGQGLRLARQTIEILHDPLVHLVRNAVDHGIERPEARLNAHKRAAGRIEIRAEEKEGVVRIVLADDGRGIDLDAVRAKAIARGLVDPEKAGQLSERQLVDFIFAPGFSTAERVSEVSGRGVGMDVVVSNLRRVGGEVVVTTEKGRGTRVELTLPKAGSPVIEGFTFKVGGVTYLLPLKSVRRTLRLGGLPAVRIPGGGTVALLDGGAVPFLELHESVESRSEGTALVVEDRAGRRAIVPVDAVLGKRRALIQTMTGVRNSGGCLAGAFMLGDGSIGFVIDEERMLAAQRN